MKKIITHFEKESNEIKLNKNLLTQGGSGQHNLKTNIMWPSQNFLL